MARKQNPWKQVQRAIRRGDPDQVAFWRAECEKESQAQTAKRKAYEERLANGPTAQLQALTVGQSKLFPQYRLPSQVSAILQWLRVRYQMRFKCAAEFSLVDDSYVGLRVTRVK